MKKFILLLTFCLMLASCKGKEPEPPPGSITVSDPGKTIAVSAGNEFKIVIDSNPSTGYHWELIGDLDAAILQFVSKDYRASQMAAPGAGGQDVWMFKALAAGEATITLGYYPPSNEAVEPAQTVAFTVVVK